MIVKLLIFLPIWFACCNPFIVTDASAYTVRQDHPRLFDEGILKTRAAQPDYRRILSQLKNAADYDMPTPVDVLCRDRGRYLSFVKLYALMYLYTQKDKYFRKASSCIDYYIAHHDFFTGMKDDYDVLNYLESLAYFYDECHEKLSPGEQKRIRNLMLECIHWLDRNGFLTSRNFGGSHLNHAHKVIGLACLSVYGEAQWAEGYLSGIIKDFKGSFVPFYQYLLEDNGGFHMWWEYTRYYIEITFEFCHAWESATGEDLLKEYPWFNNVFKFELYGLRDDLTTWGTGDNHARQPSWQNTVVLRKLASEYGNRYAQYLADKEDKLFKWPETDELIYDFWWKDFSVKPKPVDDLPLVYQAKRVGVFVFREGWKGDNVAALFKCTPTYFFNHSHRDANSFEIWYKDDLAIDSGAYDYYGSPHWFNYYIRTIATNSVTIFDPNEKIADWDKIESNDGGQLFSQFNHEQPYNVDDLKSGAFHVADSQLLEDNENYSLAVGDATKAYSRHKCELFKRYFIWLKKVDGWKHPVIVVMDHVISAKPEFKKTWMLHSINKPQVKDGLITIINGGGKLWCQVIEPKNFKIELVGGPGREFEVNGKNYPADYSHNGQSALWAGAWRVELGPVEKEKETRFLTVLVPTERGTKNPPLITPIENGVQVANWQVTWEKDGVKVGLSAKK